MIRPERRVAVAGTATVWTGLAGWVDAVIRAHRHARPAAVFYTRLGRIVRSLARMDIERCADPATLDAAEALIRGRAGLLHGPDRVLTRAERGDLLVAIHNRRRRIAGGRLDAPPRPKGPRLDPARLPDDRLDGLIQRHPDLALVERLRAERARRRDRETPDDPDHRHASQRRA